MNVGGMSVEPQWYGDLRSVRTQGSMYPGGGWALKWCHAATAWVLEGVWDSGWTPFVEQCFCRDSTNSLSYFQGQQVPGSSPMARTAEVFSGNVNHEEFLAYLFSALESFFWLWANFSWAGLLCLYLFLGFRGSLSLPCWIPVFF